MEVLDLEGFSKLKKIDFGTEPKLRALTLKNLPELSNIRSNGDENANMPYHLSLFKFMALEHIKKLCIINCGKPLDEKVSFQPFFFCFFLCHLKYLETFTIKIYIF